MLQHRSSWIIGGAIALSALMLAAGVGVGAAIWSGGSSASTTSPTRAFNSSNLPPSCDAGRAPGDLNVKYGQTCSLVSGIDPRDGPVSRQVRLDFPLDNHYYASISNVGDTDCAQYYVRNPLTIPVGMQDYPDYNGGSTNSYGPRVINGKRCILVFTGKRG